MNLKVLSTSALVLSLTILSANSAQAAESTWQKSLAAANANLQAEKLGAAEVDYRKSLRAIAATSHTVDELVRCQNGLANALALENNTDEACLLYKKSLAALEGKYGLKSAKLMPTLLAIGSIFESNGDHALAYRYYQRAIAINEAGAGSYTPAFADQFHPAKGYNLPNGQALADARSRAGTLQNLPDLASSNQMQEMTGRGERDLLAGEDDTDRSLVADFKAEILGNANADVAFNKLSSRLSN